MKQFVGRKLELKLTYKEDKKMKKISYNYYYNGRAVSKVSIHAPVKGATSATPREQEAAI